MDAQILVLLVDCPVTACTVNSRTPVVDTRLCSVMMCECRYVRVGGVTLFTCNLCLLQSVTCNLCLLQSVGCVCILMWRSNTVSNSVDESAVYVSHV